MGLKYAVDDLASVDEADRARYKQEPGPDGKYRLDIEGIEADYEPREAVANLKNAVTAERRSRTELEKKLSELREIDPERYRALVDAEAQREREQAEAKGEWTKLQEKMAAEHHKIVEEKDKRIKSQDEELAQAVVVDGIIRALHAQGAMSGKAEQVLIDAIRPSVTITRDGGRPRALVHDADGSPAITIDEGKPRPKTLDDLVRDLKEDQVFGRLFQGNKHLGLEAGAGASGNGEPPSPGDFPLERDLSQWTVRERSAYVQKHGTEAWNQLVIQNQIARQRRRPGTAQAAAS